MYIPDRDWDQLIRGACDNVASLDYFCDLIREDFKTNEEGRKLAKLILESRGILNAFINLEDQPVPRKKRIPLNGFQKIRKGRDLMRKFTKYFIIRYAKERINKIRNRKIKSTRLPKST